MFGGSKNRQQPGKIRLPKLTVFPNYEVLKGLFEQAHINRGQEVELGWAIPGSMKSYVINIKFDKVTSSPQWQVWEDDGRQTKLVSKFETNDLNLILDVVMMLETQSGGSQAQSGMQATIPPDGFQSLSQTASQSAPFTNTGQYQSASPQTNTGQYQSTSQVKKTMPLEQYKPQANPSNTGQYQSTAQFQKSGGGNNQQDNFSGTPISGFPGGGGGGPSSAATQGAGMPQGSLPADFYSDGSGAPGGNVAPQAMQLEGNLSQIKITDVMTNVGMSKLTGLLEVAGESSVAQIYVVDGAPKHAQAGANMGDDVVKELVTWRTGNYSFKPDLRTDMTSCERSLQASIMEGTALLEQLKQLEDAGLVYESVLVPKQKNLSDTELKLLLSKGHPLDFEWQKSMYKLLSRKKTFTDLLRDKPMEKSQWAPLLFNFLYCGIIDIKPPSSNKSNALDFLGDGKQAVYALKYNFIKPETGIFTQEAIFYFLEYEYHRYDAYEWPLAFILFEFSKRKPGGSIAVEPPPAEVVTVAAKRIELVKRPLDTLGHFEGTDLALILPNTRTSQAAYVANRIFDALTNTPLSGEIDKRNLVTSFGVSGLPSDGEELKDLVDSARLAKNEAKEGTFPIVLSKTLKTK